jgi:hypothetical protein
VELLAVASGIVFASRSLRGAAAEVHDKCELL